MGHLGRVTEGDITSAERKHKEAGRETQSHTQSQLARSHREVQVTEEYMTILSRK